MVTELPCSQNQSRTIPLEVLENREVSLEVYDIKVNKIKCHTVAHWKGPAGLTIDINLEFSK